MIVSALFLFAHQDAQPTAAEVVSKMIARYHGAKRLKGTSTTTIELGGEKLVVKTTLQIERPGKIFVRQEVPSQGAVFVVTCDGKEFSYQKPMDTPNTDRNPRARLIEDFSATTTLGDVYRAAGQSLAERSPVLDLAISDSRDLVALRDQWASLELTGKQDLDGEEVYRIVGKWRLNKLSPVNANFGMFVTPNGDLRKYVIDQLPGTVTLGQGDYDGTVTRTMVVRVEVDAELDPKLFTVLK